MTEQWTEVRCIACVPLGWYSSHLLLRIEGVMSCGTNDVKLQIKCPRCKSIVQWTFGKPEFEIIEQGNRNLKRMVVAFE